MRLLKFQSLLLLAPFILTSCTGSSGPNGPPTPKTARIGGVITIDGQPAPMGLVELKLYPKGRELKPGEHVPKCRVGADGKFVFSSYRDGDGAEPGDYVLSVEYLRMGGPGAVFGPDKFLNNFNSPTNEDPRFQVKVVDGTSGEIPAIDIKMSELKAKPIHPFASPNGKQR
jgi:hypothetical protein